MKHKVGNIVWAHLDGFPWWPGRIIEPFENHLAKLNISSVPAGSCLVLFYNDNDRFSLVESDALRHFDNPRMHERAMTFKGPFHAERRMAFKMALSAYRAANSTKTSRGSNDGTSSPRPSRGPRPAPTDGPSPEPLQRSKSRKHVTPADDAQRPKKRKSRDLISKETGHSDHRAASKIKKKRRKDPSPSNTPPGSPALEVSSPPRKSSSHDMTASRTELATRHAAELPALHEPKSTRNQTQLEDPASLETGPSGQPHRSADAESDDPPKRSTLLTLRIKRAACPDQNEETRERSDSSHDGRQDRQGGRASKRRRSLAQREHEHPRKSVKVSESQKELKRAKPRGEQTRDEKRSATKQSGDPEEKPHSPVRRAARSTGLRRKRHARSEDDDNSRASVERSKRDMDLPVHEKSASEGKADRDDANCSIPRKSLRRTKSNAGAPPKMERRRRPGIEPSDDEDGENKDEHVNGTVEKEEDRAVHVPLIPADLGDSNSIDMEDGKPFQNLTKEQCIQLILNRQAVLRRKNVELWLRGHRLVDSKDVIQTEEEMIEACSAATKKAEKLIRWVEKHEGHARNADSRFRQIERDAFDAAKSLYDVYFDTQMVSLKKVGKRMLGLSRDLISISRPLSTALRDLLVLWVDLTTPEAQTKQKALNKSKGVPQRRSVPQKGERTGGEDGAGGVARKPVGGNGDGGVAEGVRKGRRDSEDRTEVKEEASPGSKAAGSTSVEGKKEERRAGDKRDKQSARREKRMRNFNKKAFCSALGTVLERATGVSVEAHERFELVQRLESELTPREEDDKEGYYKASVKMMRGMQRVLRNLAVSGGNEAERGECSLTSLFLDVVKDVNKTPEFVKRCLSEA